MADDNATEDVREVTVFGMTDVIQRLGSDDPSHGRAVATRNGADGSTKSASDRRIEKTSPPSQTARAVGGDLGVGGSLEALRDEGKTNEQLLAELRAVRGQLAEFRNAGPEPRASMVAHECQTRHVEKLAALGSLAAGIAHELNNPIGIILSRIELMLMDAEDRQGPAEVVEDLRVLHRQAQRLNRITGGLLSYGRRPHDASQPIDVRTVIQDTLLLAHYQLGRDGIDVSTAFDMDLPCVLGDATALQQVFMNLLLNARDAMPNGGRLRIVATRTSDQPGWIRLVVADTGGGMAADVLARIAQPFFTTKSHGTGLGLSVSYTIIREHGGGVEVTSEPGRGTTFTITLPSLAESSRTLN